MLISDDFWLKVPKIAKRVPRFLADIHKDGYFFNKYNNTVLRGGGQGGGRGYGDRGCGFGGRGCGIGDRGGGKRE